MSLAGSSICCLPFKVQVAVNDVCKGRQRSPGVEARCASGDRSELCYLGLDFGKQASTEAESIIMRFGARGCTLWTYSQRPQEGLLSPCLSSQLMRPIGKLQFSYSQTYVKQE